MTGDPGGQAAAWAPPLPARPGLGTWSGWVSRQLFERQHGIPEGRPLCGDHPCDLASKRWDRQIALFRRAGGGKPAGSGWRA
jgi:hypothetical protein